MSRTQTSAAGEAELTDAEGDAEGDGAERRPRGGAQREGAEEDQRADVSRARAAFPAPTGSPAATLEASLLSSSPSLVETPLEAKGDDSGEDDPDQVHR